MPEVGIGFIPDVGGTFLLSRAPGLLGLHAALTGAPFGAGDAIAMGFADHFVPQHNLEEFTAAVIADGVEGAVAAHAVEPPPSPLAAQRGVDRPMLFRETIADIRGPCVGTAKIRPTEAADLIATRSPIALSVTLAAVRRAATLPSLDDVLVQEYRCRARPCGRMISWRAFALNWWTRTATPVVAVLPGRGDRRRCAAFPEPLIRT